MKGSTAIEDQGIKLCRGCGAALTSENDSAAHILPNALGGRLKPKGIICRVCNTELDKVADNKLVEAFGAWPVLLNIPRDDSKRPPKILETRYGRKVRYEPDGPLNSVDVVYHVSTDGDKSTVHITSGNNKTFEQLLKRAAKQFPQLDLTEAKKNVRNVAVDDGDELKMTLDFSPEAVFGGIFSTIWLFIIYSTGKNFIEWPRLLQCIAEMQIHGGMFRYFPEGLPGLEGPETNLGHKIIVRTVPSSGELIAYVEVFGVLRVGGVFAKAPSPVDALEHIYAYDLALQTDISNKFSIDPTVFESQSWQNAGLGPIDTDMMRQYLSDSLKALSQCYQQRLPAASL